MPIESHHLRRVLLPTVSRLVRRSIDRREFELQGEREIALDGWCLL